MILMMCCFVLFLSMYIISMIFSLTTRLKQHLHKNDWDLGINTDGNRWWMWTRERDKNKEVCCSSSEESFFATLKDIIKIMDRFDIKKRIEFNKEPKEPKEPDLRTVKEGEKVKEQ